MPTRWCPVAVGIAIILGAAPAAYAQICKYKIEVLQPAIPGYDWCAATALSDKSHVVGTCHQEFGEEKRAFVLLHGVTTNVGVLPGYNQGWGAGVNNYGDVVGQSGLSFDPFDNKAHYFTAGTWFDLETWTQDPVGDTNAHDVNDSGEIVGTDDYDRAVYWLNGTMTYLGDWGTRAFAINAVGQIAGSANGHAVRWDNLTMVDLGGMPGGTWAEAQAIADNGNIAGWGATPSGLRGFFYTPSDPTLKVIGTFGGNTSWAKGVSSEGLAVGYAYDAAGGSHGFVWRKGQLYDLTNLLHDNNPNDPWSVWHAFDINEKGQILVAASNSKTGAYLLLHPSSCQLTSSRACCPF